MNATATLRAGLLLAAAVLTASHAHAQATFYGPTAYTCESNSPFTGLSLGYFYLETFEDHLFNVPGVSVNGGGVTSIVFGPFIHDSVDCDDGSLDGSGLAGDSFFGPAGNTRFTFDRAALGALPTHAGVVWTDGGSGAVITFEAYDAAGVSLGTLTGNHADDLNSGQTGEDRFYGVTHAAGISSIRIGHTTGGLELDHLQYGGPGSGTPCAADIGIAGGLPGQDSALDNNDFIVFIGYFFDSNSLGDRGVAGGGAGSDGLFNNNDFIAFINQFFQGC